MTDKDSLHAAGLFYTNITWLTKTAYM
jgi:hypothetical protein